LYIYLAFNCLSIDFAFCCEKHSVSIHFELLHRVELFVIVCEWSLIAKNTLRFCSICPFDHAPVRDLDADTVFWTGQERNRSDWRSRDSDHTGRRGQDLGVCAFREGDEWEKHTHDYPSHHEAGSYTGRHDCVLGNGHHTRQPANEATARSVEGHPFLIF